MHFDNLWPRIRNKLVTLSLRRRGVSVRDKVVITGKLPRVVNLGAIALGYRVKFRAPSHKIRLKANPNATISIGDRTFLNDGVVVNASVGVSIGKHCLIGDGVEMFDTDFHQIEEGAEVTTAPIKIGDNVWIGREALILPGVEIGDHSVIGARSVVTKSIAARVVAAGVPAKPIRSLTASDSFVRR